MSSSFRFTRYAVALGVFGLLMLAGCPGFDLFNPPPTDDGSNNDGGDVGDVGGTEPGTDPGTNPDEPTPPGPPVPISDIPGQPAFGDNTDLPGMVITVQRVTLAGTDQPPKIGQPIAVSFTLKTRSGEAIDASELDRFSAYISGPTDNYQRVIPAEGDVTKIVTNADGSMTYTFAAPLPDKFAAPLNDSGAFGEDDGEWTGKPLMDATYTIGVEARRMVPIDEEEIRDAGDAMLDFVIGNATLTPRKILVTEVRCESCHGQVSVHGGNRLSVSACVLCHTNGGEDRKSKDPAKATDGCSIQFANMIHQIHRGFDLPIVRATQNSADPAKYEIVGFGESLIDFSGVKFPMMPGGTGFNQQTRNCVACHGDAEHGDQAFDNPNAAACLGCHNDVNLSEGTRLNFAQADVAAGKLTKSQLNDGAFREQIGGFRHSFSDDQCVLCHAPGTALDSRVVHMPPLSDPAFINGINVNITGVGGATGAGFFQIGDALSVTFQVKDGNGVPIDLANVSSLSLMLCGPTGNYQRVLPATGSTVTVKGAGGVPTSGVGPFTFTTAAIPAVYPAPFSDSTAFTYIDGWGELGGQALASGTYTLGMWGYRQFTAPDGNTYREASPLAQTSINIGASGALDPYPGFITDAKCNACHGEDIRFHGNGRRGVDGCILCHTGGAEDRMNPLAGQTQDPAPDTIDFKVMIHKIHNARDLDVVTSGGKYDLIGYASGQPSSTGNVVDLSNGDLPYMQGGAKDCTACHATDAWKAPVERHDVRIWMVACSSCHDSQAAATHIDINTGPSDGVNPGAESCATCHGEGRAFSIERSHRIP